MSGSCDILLVYPRGGLYQTVYKPWIPLPLLATASILDREGYRVRILDTRLTKAWKSELFEAAKTAAICVGITAFTGSRIVGALEASQTVREAGRVPIVWGGIHPSLFPETTLQSPWIDAIVQGEGEVAFHELARALREGSSCDGIRGVWTKSDGEIRGTPRRPFLELNSLPDLPYHLVDISRYLHRYFSERDVLEVETSRGCPYGCRFCYNSALHLRNFRAYGPERVVDNLERLYREHRVRAFHVIDDAFFVDRRRAREIMELIIRKNLPIRMGFQGVRIDTIESLTDEDLGLLHRAGGRFLQIGVESGSPRILQLIGKGITIDQVLSQNRRLARYPGLIALYNFMCGFPSETRVDLFESTRLASALLDENRQAIVSPFHLYKPYPGTSLYPMAEKRDTLLPRTLDDWARWDWTESTRKSGSKGFHRLAERVHTASIFVDQKVEMQADSRFLVWLVRLYRPFARARFRRNLYAFMPEHWLLRALGWAQGAWPPSKADRRLSKTSAAST